ncbi:hypothetical protein [Microbacterium sp. 22242]|uniref:hypothetical protein n=1 Tax=Microbacterium sp. 22242 TaxID=3453896 RepID=UPI003F83F105
MAFDVLNSEGVAVCGDRVFEERMRRRCDEVDGWVVDVETGRVVYESPARLNAREV